MHEIQRIVQVGKGRPCERLTVERGDHVHQSRDRVGERRRSLEEIRDTPQERISELRKALLMLLRGVGHGQV